MARLIIVEDNSELASLVVSAARSRGHEATTVQTGVAAVQALGGGGAFDAAVVDLLLPDISGLLVLARLRKQGIPAIAISGVYRGEKFAREAVERHGAAQFFEKPFDLNALLEAVEAAAGVNAPLDAELVLDEEEEEVLSELEELSPEAEEAEVEDPGGEPLVPVPELDDEPHTPTRPLEEAELAALVQGVLDEEAHLHPPEPEPDLEEEVPTRVAPPPPDLHPPESEADLEVDQALESLEALDSPIGMVEEPPVPKPARGPGGAVGLAHELAVTVSHRPPRRPVPALATKPEPLPEIPEQALATPEPLPPTETPFPEAVLLPFQERGRVWHQQERPAGKKTLPDWSEGGDLAETSVPKLLNAFYEARHSGELKLKQDSVTKVISLENGLPVYAASNLATERFGRFCVRRGAIKEAELNRVAALAELEGIRTGESMVRLGLVGPREHRQLLEEQVREIIWSTFGWTRGQYSMVPKRPGRQDLVKLELFPGELILEGVSRTQTLVSLRQKMPPARRLSPAPDPPYQQQDLSLTEPQASLLAAADGSKSVEDLLTLTDLSEREALAALTGFELLGLLVERRDEGKRQRISFGL